MTDIHLVVVVLGFLLAADSTVAAAASPALTAAILANSDCSLDESEIRRNIL
jgi:hypothetical protein